MWAVLILVHQHQNVASIVEGIIGSNLGRREGSTTR
jgi:hypothetical protein